MASKSEINQLKNELSSRFSNAFNLDKNVKPSVRNFNQKCDSKSFDKFTSTDWIFYFQLKARENSFNYKPQNYRNDHSVLKCIMKKYSANEIKDMIDFIWDCDHDLRPKYQCGIYLLSKKWICTIENCTHAWKENKYYNNKQWKQKRAKKVKRRREWDSKQIETSKDEIYI